MVEIELTMKQKGNMLYYESGNEQLHPRGEIIDWMEERGYIYQQDWNCIETKQAKTVLFSVQHHYKLTFSTEAAASAFLLRWS
jgi:hypothetical protein